MNIMTFAFGKLYFAKQTTHRSSCSHIFSKIGVLKYLTNFPGKHLCWSHFSIKLQVLHASKTSVFLWNLWNLWKHLLLQNTSGGCFLTQLLLHVKMHFSKTPRDATRNWAVFFRLINWLTFNIYKYIDILAEFLYFIL